MLDWTDSYITQVLSIKSTHPYPIPKEDVEAVLNTATIEFSEDLREDGDVPAPGGFYDRIVRSVSLELVDENHLVLCPYSKAIEVIRGVRSYMRVHGYFTLQASVYREQGQTATLITDVNVARWPEVAHQQRYYTSSALELLRSTKCWLVLRIHLF